MPRRLVVAAVVLAGVCAPAQAVQRGTVPLTNDWSAWRAADRVAGATATHRGSLRLALPAATTRGSRASVRITLPRRVRISQIAMRVSYTTPGARVYVATGARPHVAWRAATNARRRQAVVRVRLRGARIITVGLQRVAPSRRPAVLTVHAYALSVRGAPSVPVPADRAHPADGPVLTASGAVVSGIPGAPSPTSGARPGTGPGTPGGGDVGGVDPRSVGVYWGARIGGSTYGTAFGDAPWDPATLARFEANAGRGVSLVAWGQAWRDHGRMQRFDTALYEGVRQHGSIPVIDWAPWDLAARGSNDQPEFQLQDVIRGDYDPYIREWARGAAAWGHPFFLRFCHEMNGTWYPWSEARNGNSPGEFAAMWRHVHDIFVAEGAANVSWVWSINEVESYQGIPLERLYPGDAYVDWVGMSGYNWGTGQPRSGWRSFARTFTNTYARLRTMVPHRPLMITELASAEQGGDKGQWITDALGVQLPRNFPAVRAVVWWNKSDEMMPWPIETSPGATAAFRVAINSGYYAANGFSSVSASPIPAG